MHFMFSFLKLSRPLSVSMGNAIKWLKVSITKLPGDISEAEVSLDMVVNALIHY